MKLIISCEHAGNEIPPHYAYLFENNKEVLNSHQGIDLGAFDIYKKLVKLADYHEHTTTSRLLIEVNRSQHHRSLFSEFTKSLSPDEKTKLIEKYFSNYRDKIENKIKEYIALGENVLHISVHSFTPVLNGIVREANIGLLYDPANNSEKEFSKLFKTELKVLNPRLKIRYNYPYKGTADGFTTYLRRRFPLNYAGIELEINQSFADEKSLNIVLKNNIYKALKITVNTLK
ncbi:N-formylglutamate amidohydrolase [Gillisia sp. M10.2A]|uniref:N-formylglutamate amidohydrolase n=1 Tax=Gillisia lutea TaxID=2909668 RepID=A0ABS9EJ98_9FLAO|nr:N-formylglutamate amidohydrolase [Gillisia lutea]MCF4101521.1 N-formylglutamate amidohydrolase [Gillisia lutea]